MKFRNRKKFQYDIPAYTGPFRALIIGEIKWGNNILKFAMTVVSSSRPSPALHT
jgi:hypothetical protein